jgi:hypothetical protein
MKAPSAPSSGDKLDLNALNGSLLYIKALAEKRDIETSFGKADAIQANVTVLDGPHKGAEYDDVLIFPRVLASQLRGDIGGDAILARLGKGEAKPGKSAPWMLKEPSDDDRKTGEKFEAYAAKRALEQEQPF